MERQDRDREGLLCHDEAVALEEVGGAAGCGAEEDVGETEGFLDAPSSMEGDALESE